jgi:hypothetical protein
MASCYRLRQSDGARPTSACLKRGVAVYLAEPPLWIRLVGNRRCHGGAQAGRDAKVGFGAIAPVPAHELSARYRFGQGTFARRSPPSRGFVHRRLSDAGPCTGSIARAGPASETLPDSRLSHTRIGTTRFDPFRSFTSIYSALTGLMLSTPGNGGRPVLMSQLQPRTPAIPPINRHFPEVRGWSTHFL